MDVKQKLLEMMVQTSWWEWMAVISALIHVGLLSIRWILAWPIGIISSGLYAYIFFMSQLYLETGLQFFYIIMALYGWFSWSKPIDVSKKVTRIRLEKHVLIIGFSGGVCFMLAFIFDQFTRQTNPYADAFVTVFSLVTTWMMARKYVDSWIYWIIIDVVAATLYIQNGLVLSALLYAIYTIIAAFGFVAWRRQIGTT
jgi:nicotinamide mononucleotide transporter